jgi:hypothetical protein
VARFPWKASWEQDRRLRLPCLRRGGADRMENCPPKLGGQHDRITIMRGVRAVTFGSGTTSRDRFAIPLPS